MQLLIRDKIWKLIIKTIYEMNDILCKRIYGEGEDYDY